jgi:TolB-like protein/Tfp pilus assembly protein PilF
LQPNLKGRIQSPSDFFQPEFTKNVRNGVRMNGTKALSAVLRFGTFEVDLRLREVRKHGLHMRLEEKPFQILELLLEKPGELITRGALRKRLWPDTIVGYEHGLNTAVRKLRELLGDSAQSPRFVETIPRRGYRFIAPVENPSKVAAGSGKLMLVVLPFQNLGGDAEQEFFADGLTEEIIAHLGQLNPRRLGVIARSSAVHYKNSGKSIHEIATELGADFAMEGSVRRAGKRVRITTNLIETKDQTHVWSAIYDRELRDILSVQQDVSLQLGSALAIELLPEQRRAVHRPDPAAQEAYLRGRFYCAQFSEEALKKAVASFDEALSLDPGFAGAHSGIADCCNLLCWFGAHAPREAGPRAAQAAARALELDDSRAESHASLGLVRYWYNWDWKDAEKEFRRAIELNPSNANARLWYGGFLRSMGRLDEAQEETSRARELDPLSLIVNMNAAGPLYFGRQFDLAIEHLRAILEREPKFLPALFNLGHAYVQAGMHEQAVATFEKAVQLSGNRQGLAALAHAHARAGSSEEARGILSRLQSGYNGRYLASPLLALIHVGLGEDERAIDFLEKGVEERSYWMVFLKMDPVYDALRCHPRFQTILERVGFFD